MRFDGPTVALHNGFGCAAMGLPDFSNMPMPAATSAASRLMNRTGAGPPLMPPPLKNPGLSLGLHQPDMLQLEPKPMYEMDLTQQQQQHHQHHHVNVKSRSKDDENESRSASGSENMGNISGDEQGPPTKKKRYHRHTARQIQEMEELFKECPHPDDKQRQELSRELGLEPRQVKFWFQNRRTQLKAQQERAENSMLRVEIEKLRAENITMREAIRHASCPNCGGPASLRDMSLEEQQLRIENACLKDELERVSAVAARFFGRSIPPILSQPPQFSSSSTVLNLSNPASAAVAAPTLAPTAAPEPVNMLPPAGSMMDDLSNNSNKMLSDVDKSDLMNAAALAMEELVHLCQPDCSVWMSMDNSCKDMFNADEYLRLFPKDKLPGFKTDASRDSGLVMMNAANLVDIFMDSAKWMELFSCNVSKALTLDVLCTNISGSLSGTLQLMYAELQVPSPLIQTREIYFLRYCKQLVDGTWAIVDVSVDGLRGTPTPSLLHCQKRPSGFLIHDMPDGSSKVVVVEHTEYDDQSMPQLFRSLVSSGGAFGAQRSLATLQRQCEGLANFLPGINSAREFGSIPNSAARQSLLKLSQRMTNSFCAGVGASSTHTWTTLSGAGGDDVRVMTRKSIDNPGEPHGIVLSAATTIWLPSSPQRVFEYLRCEHVRNEWSVTPTGGNVQEIERIAKGQLGNDVSLYSIGSMDMEQNMFILQESSTDASGSLVVYAPVEVSTIKMMMQGGDPAHMAVLPSGFALLPDGSSNDHSIDSATAPSTSNSTTTEPTSAGGSLLTVAVQILVSTMPSAKLSLESIVAINNLISSTVQKVKAAL